MIINVRHNGRVFQIEYAGTVSDQTVKDFCSWANTTAGVDFMHDFHHELVTGLERRKVHTKKPPQISGYGLSQWVRFIYGHNFTNTWGPLTAKLYVAIHPEFVRLFKSKS
jgi:hypothetical protein